MFASEDFSQNMGWVCALEILLNIERWFVKWTKLWRMISLVIFLVVWNENKSILERGGLQLAVTCFDLLTQL